LNLFENKILIYSSEKYENPNIKRYSILRIPGISALKVKRLIPIFEQPHLLFARI